MNVERNLTDQEQDCINELKGRLKGEMDEELYDDKGMFYRFLKARDFDVKKAEAMLRKHLEWREKYDVKNIMNWKKPEVGEKYFPFVNIGEDREGCVVRYVPTGNLDGIGLNNSMKFDDIMKIIIYTMEMDMIAFKNQTKKLGKIVDKAIYIHDMRNFSLVQATDKRNLNNVIYTLKLYQDNYPEILKALYIINASTYFSFVFKVAKPFLAKTILSKLHIYSSDSYKRDLVEVIDADVLPAFLGGNRTDPDGNPMCFSLINYAGPVPESYYIHRSKQSLAQSPGVEKVTLPRATFHEVFFEVKEPESYLEWEFETKCRDIGFGLFKQQEKDGEKCNVELIRIQRINTDEFAEAGLFKCEEVGSYVLVFDNRYSWVRQKKIFYRIKVLTPEEYEARLNG